MFADLAALQFLERLGNDSNPNHVFYADRAVEHGRMAAYYLGKIIETQSPDSWDFTHAVSEAKEAWHYVQLLNDVQVAAEIERQAEVTRLNDALRF